MFVSALMVCSALCFDEEDKRMIRQEIVKFGYKVVRNEMRSITTEQAQTRQQLDKILSMLEAMQQPKTTQTD